MKKTKILLVIMCLISIILISGCSEQNNQNNTTGKTITMTAEELQNDNIVTQGSDNLKIDYKSLNDGDTLIVEDTIFYISYDINLDRTTTLFIWEKENSSVGSLSFEFEGNITGSYFNESHVKITVEIKHVIFSYQNMNYDLELFAPQWVNENYYVSQKYKPLPQSCISSV